MIEFCCSKCDKKYTVPPEYAGKKARCKECNHTNVVPLKSAAASEELISLKCEKCSHPLKVKSKYAGKKLKCPKCAAICLVPDGSAVESETKEGSSLSFNCATCGVKLSAKEGMQGQAIECTGCGTLAEVPYSGTSDDMDLDYDPSQDDAFLKNLVALGADAKNAEEVEIERPKKKAKAGAKRASDGGFLKKLFGK